VVIAETRIRSQKQREYEFFAERRSECIKGREERRLAEIRRREENIKKLNQSRIELIDGAIDRLVRSNSLRELITALDHKFRDSKVLGLDYSDWRTWALKHADDIDPRTMKVDQIEHWIAKFRMNE
jgi:hypothetical protein